MFLALLDIIVQLQTTHQCHAQLDTTVPLGQRSQFHVHWVIHALLGYLFRPCATAPTVYNSVLWGNTSQRQGGCVLIALLESTAQCLCRIYLSHALKTFTAQSEQISQTSALASQSVQLVGQPQIHITLHSIPRC